MKLLTIHHVPESLPGALKKIKTFFKKTFCIHSFDNLLNMHLLIINYVHMKIILKIGYDEHSNRYILFYHR